MFDKGKRTGPYVFGLEHVPLPAVVCDSSGQIFWSNNHFLNIVGQAEVLPNTVLAEVVDPKEESKDVLDFNQIFTGGVKPPLVIIDENPYEMYIGQLGDLFGCVFAPIHREESFDSVPPKPPSERSSTIPPPSGNKLLEAFIFLSREMNMIIREEELIQIFVRTYRDLFPDRLFCLRLFEPKRKKLIQIYANGQLLKEQRDLVKLTQKAREEHGLNDENAASLIRDNKMVAIEEYEPIFIDGKSGFDVPLYDGNELFGIVNIEYNEDDGPVATDRPIAVPLTHQMCAALRNARLLAETILLKDYLEKLLDRANAPVLVVNHRRRITVVNQAFERLTGYDRKDVLGEDLMLLVPENEQARLLPVILAALRGEATSNFEVRLPNAKGHEAAHIAFNTAVLLSSSGDLEGVIFVGQDLTEIRALQSQVIHSEKLATLGQVVAGVAHELNNPLTSISVYASYLVKKFENSIEEADLARIRRIVEAADRIQAFTRDLVVYARPSGEEPTLIKISDLIERTLSFCEHLIAQSNADVSFDIIDDLKHIFGIHGHLEQVFVNLITNACHALPDTGGKIHITAHPVGKDQIQVSIRDTGHGIPKDQLDNVFEPFYTTKPVGEGTGLGLSVIRNILLNHDADIKVQSKLGEGTTFTITMRKARLP